MEMTEKDFLKVIKGFMSGKQIEAYDGSCWVDVDSHIPLEKIVFNIIEVHQKYRIKPESKYRPYETIEEAIELVGKFIQHKERNLIELVYDIKLINNSLIINGMKSIYILDNYEYYDKDMRHIPLGVKE